MYKILLVEDIDIIRKDIAEMINWKSCGYTMTGEARNGEQGLEFYKNNPADIVITDIRMPVMDGLTMIREILRLYPYAQFIVLTAYEEFDYAKQAMKMGINSYLLKHEIDPEVLLAELEKIKASIDQNQSYQLLCKSDILRRYLNSNDGQDAASLQLYPWSGPTVLILLENRDVRCPDRQIGFYPLLKELRHHLPNEDYVCYALSESIYLFLVRYSDFLHTPHVSDNGSAAFTDALQELEAVRSLRYAISVSPVYSDIASFPRAYTAAKELLSEKIFFKESCILMPFQIHGIPDSALKQINQQKNLLQEYLNSAKLYQAQKIIRGLLEEKLPLFRSVELYQSAVTFIINEILEIQHLKLPMEMIQTLTEIKTTAMQSDIYMVSEGICRILERIQQELIPRYSRKIEEVLRYIKEHYQEDITLSGLSVQLNISPLYVSQLFKKEVGINLMTYITRYRIQIAEELLKSGKYKVYEVSEMVGYQTVQYFSNSFKKETGRKPSELCQ